MKTRLLSEEKILKPLIQLGELLAGLEKILAQFKISYSLVKEIAAPSFSSKILTFIGRKEEVSDENKAIFMGLVAKIDANNQLLARLEVLQEQLAAYCSAVNNTKNSMSQIIEDSPKKIAHHMAVCAENLIKEFEADYGRYIATTPILSEYLESEKKHQRDYEWINIDLAMFRNFVDEATAMNKQIKELLFQEMKFISLDDHSLKKIEALKEKFEDEPSFLVVKNNIEELLLDASQLLKISDGSSSLLETKNEIEEDLTRLQELLEFYKKVESEYITLDIGRIQQDSGEIRRVVDEYLQEAELFNNKNKEKIFNCLREYLEYSGSEESAAQLDAAAQLNGFMLERAKVAENLKVRALPLMAREAQFQRELGEIQKKLKELNEDSDKNIFSKLGLEWSQSQELLFEKLGERWGVEKISHRIKFIDDQLSVLGKKEVDLAASKFNLNFLVDNNKNIITDFFQCLSVDVSCGLVGSIQHLNNNYYQLILDEIKKLNSHLSVVREKENQLSVLCKEMASAKSEYDRNNFFIEKAESACELLQRQVIKFNENIRSAVDIEQKWKSMFQHDSGKFAMAFAGFELSPIVNVEPFRLETAYVNAALSSFPLTAALPIDGKFDHLKEYADCIADVNLLVDFLRNIKINFDNHLNKEYFDQIPDNLQQLLKANELLNVAISKEYVNFSAHYNKRDWPNIDEARQKFIAANEVYPAQLKRNIELLKQSLVSLYGHQGLQSQANAEQEAIKNYISLIGDGLAALTKYKNYIDFYTLAYGQHEKWVAIATEKVAEIEQILNVLVEKKNVFSELAKNNKKCSHLIPSLEKSIKLIIKRRYAVIEELKNVALSDGFNKLKTAMEKINNEEAFANSVKRLLKELADLKRNEENTSKEVFALLRREFIFSDKSREIIEKLKLHGDLALQQNRAKGKLIMDFINNLTNPDNVTDINHMAKFLADENNKALIENTGVSNLLGCSSTTGVLLDELRTTWVALVRRENEGNRGSIRYALNNDYSQIKKEYQQILREQNITIQVAATGLKYTYERFAQNYLVNVPDDHLPLAVWKKIQQDYLEIQRWSGVDKSGLPLRHIRMQCAYLIREAEDVSRRNDGLHQRLQGMANNHPFTFAYHTLKCHLEKYPSNREGSKKKLWRMLDEIAFGEGTENDKYGKMRESILAFYKELREKPNGSAGFFFGKGSKFGDGLEAFLKISQNPIESYEWGLGYAADQIHHRRPETNVDKATRWVRDQVFCCIPRKI